MQKYNDEIKTKLAEIDDLKSKIVKAFEKGLGDFVGVHYPIPNTCMEYLKLPPLVTIQGEQYSNEYDFTEHESFSFLGLSDEVVENENGKVYTLLFYSENENEVFEYKWDTECIIENEWSLDIDYTNMGAIIEQLKAIKNVG